MHDEKQHRKQNWAMFTQEANNSDQLTIVNGTAVSCWKAHVTKEWQTPADVNLCLMCIYI